MQKENTIYNSRVIPFPIEKVWQAYATQELIAIWWGPHGFTNEIQKFDFFVGGHWIFDMVSPDGQKFANEIIFQQIIPNEKIYLEHLPAPHFYAKVMMRAVEEGTKLEFTMIFDDIATYEAVSKYAPEKNEENFDRLEELLKTL